MRILIALTLLCCFLHPVNIDVEIDMMQLISLLNLYISYFKYNGAYTP